MIKPLCAAAMLFAFPAAAFAEPVPPQTAATSAAELRMDHISIVSVGSGSPVILVPGLASPREVWDGIVPDLAKRHRVLLVQVNGFGGDDPGKNLLPGVIDGVVRDIVAYAKREKLEKPAIIGHSLGGVVAMMVGARHPGVAGRIMVVDSLPFFGALMMPGATAETIRPAAEQMRAGTLAAANAAAAAAPVTSDPGGIWSNNAAGRIQVANWGRKADPRVVAQALYEDVVTDLRPELGKVTARPFTILYATGAGPMAKVLWEREYAGSPATLVPIDDSYHFIMLDQPERFQAAVDDFLKP